VQKFNWEVFREVAHIYNGSLTTGLLRSPGSTLNNPYVTRFPTANLWKQASGTVSRLTHGMRGKQCGGDR
jgi:hypothetical protein